jgi:general secretion pathway protein L
LSTLYIRLPSRAVADNTAHWTALPCPFAVVAGTDTIEREGQAALADLAAPIAAAQRVVLLLAASDVTLLHVKVPPLSAARLRVALPNLVEDQLMSDPADCVMVAGDDPGSASGDLRTVAVVQRGWLQVLLQTVAGHGARHVVALPSQLCLAQPAGSAAAAVTVFGNDIDLALRVSELDGLGLPLLPDTPAQAATDVVQTVCALVPTAPVTLYVPPLLLADAQHAVDTLLALDQRVTILPDNWTRWLDGARANRLNLVTGLGGSSGARIDWARWRLPAILAALLLLLNIGAINFEWWRLSREATALRASMVQIYRTAYPKETVIADPVAQMRQKIAAAKHDAGQPAPDDFAALAAGFAQAWNSVAPGGAGSARALASLEYRDRSLLVKPKTQADLPVAPMKSALAAHNLSMAQSGPGVWQIRSIR